MADYWKSQPRKFCQYCKCWIADNKPSIEFHERGKNHKENVAAKISEIKKKSVDKAKQEKRMCKQFAAMEEAAMKAYEEDLKRMERESQGLSSPAPASTPASAPASWPAPSPAPTPAPPQPRANPPPKKQKKKQEKPRMKPFRQQSERPVWVAGVSDEGHAYYYNTTTGESRWEKPEDSQGSAQYEQTASSSGSAWKEAVSPDGYTYYYNTGTGESSWEKPTGLISSEPCGEEPAASGEPSEVEESSDPAPETQEGPDQGPDQSSQQSTIPKISFRKRKADSEPSGKEAEEEDDDEDDPASGETTKEDAKETEEEAGVVQNTTAEPEKTEEKMTGVKIRVRKYNPYGAWEKIKEQKDPYASVDLQLPQVEDSAPIAPAGPPPEAKPKFKERVITSLGEEGGPASFRRNRTQNGKSRRLRQRDDDDDD